MRILYFDSEEKRRSLNIVYLENIVDGAEVISASQFKAHMGLMQKLEISSYDLYIIISNDVPLVYEMCKACRKNNLKSPILLMSDLDFLQFPELANFHTENPKNEFAKLPMAPVEFREVILKVISPSYGLRVIHAFQKIRLIHFLRFKKALCPVYIKLSDHKYVKIINAGTIYDRLDIEKYREKKISHLFIRNDDFEKFQVQLGKTPFLETKEEPTNESELQKALENTHAILREMIEEVGFSKEAVDLAQKSVDHIINLSTQKKNLYTLIEKMQKRLDYIYDHSFLTAVVSCEILKQMHWNTEDKINKLVMASVLHDIKLTDPELCKIDSSDDHHLKNYSEKDIKDFLSHPVETSLLLADIEFISPEVGSIILQHHEKPEGDGFPNGLHHSKLSLLSCIFIIAHEYVQKNLASDFSVDEQDQIFDALKKRFSSGSFKPVMDAFLDLAPGSHAKNSAINKT